MRGLVVSLVPTLVILFGPRQSVNVSCFSFIASDSWFEWFWHWIPVSCYVSTPTCGAHYHRVLYPRSVCPAWLPYWSLTLLWWCHVLASSSIGLFGGGSQVLIIVSFGVAWTIREPLFLSSSFSTMATHSRRSSNLDLSGSDSHKQSKSSTGCLLPWVFQQVSNHHMLLDKAIYTCEFVHD